MKEYSKITKVFIISGLALVALTQTTQVQAWSSSTRHGSFGRYSGSSYFDHKHKHYNKYDHHRSSSRYGYRKHYYPNNFVSINLGGFVFHYREGHYYKKHGSHYIVVEAPVGACISSLPFGYKRVYMNGGFYYTYGGIYYKKAPGGYVVVENPSYNYVKVQEPVKSQVSDANSLTINIPGKSGEYVPVTLIRNGDGFTGPQGEYYDSFPKIELLKEIYGT